VDVPVALVLKQRRICVSMVCESKRDERVQRRDRERVEVYQGLAVFSVTEAARRL
jgi:hypothetical protein